MKLGALGLPPYRTFVPDELKEATDNFNASSLIGEGSYGQVPIHHSCLKTQSSFRSFLFAVLTLENTSSNMSNLQPFFKALSNVFQEFGMC